MRAASLSGTWCCGNTGLRSENKQTPRHENDQSFISYFSAHWLKHQHALKWLFGVIYRHVARSQSEYFCKVTSLGNKNTMRHPFGGNCPSSRIRTHFNGAFMQLCSLSSRLSDIWICEHNFSLPLAPCFLIASTHTKQDQLETVKINFMFKNG